MRTTAGSDWEWVPATEQLDKSLLMARDPILFYDEIPLYESELDDNGASQLLVKVSSICCSAPPGQVPIMFATVCQDILSTVSRSRLAHPCCCFLCPAQG